MKYVRTKDGIYESDKTILGKQMKIMISNKKTGEIITEIVCDYIEEKSIIEDMLFAEYCKTHKLNPLDYCRKTIVINPFVIAEADTIEELCDEFVWISVDNEYHNRKANEYGLRTSKMQLGCPQLKEIYGAIWTDKGLIYVAKMNEKGELELL